MYRCLTAQLTPKSGRYRDKLCKVYFKDRKQMAKKRFDEIDVMRIIGFLMVVDQHILGAYAQRADTGFAGSLVLHFFICWEGPQCLCLLP